MGRGLRGLSGSSPLQLAHVVAEGMGRHACQVGCREPILLPGTGVRVSLALACYHVGADPYGLTGHEIGCHVVESHDRLVGCLVTVARMGGITPQCTHRTTRPPGGSWGCGSVPGLVPGSTPA